MEIDAILGAVARAARGTGVEGTVAWGVRRNRRWIRRLKNEKIPSITILPCGPGGRQRMTAAAEANRRVPGGPGTGTCGLTWGCRPFGPHAGPDAIAAVATTAERLGLHPVRSFERLLVAQGNRTGWRLKPQPIVHSRSNA